MTLCMSGEHSITAFKELSEIMCKGTNGDKAMLCVTLTTGNDIGKHGKLRLQNQLLSAPLEGHVDDASSVGNYTLQRMLLHLTPQGSIAVSKREGPERLENVRWTHRTTWQEQADAATSGGLFHTSSLGEPYVQRAGQSQVPSSTWWQTEDNRAKQNKSA